MTLRTLVVFILAVVCGCSAAFGVYRFYQVTERQRLEQVSAPLETVAVVTASIDLPFVGTTLSEETVKVRQWPKGYEPSGTIASMDDVIGKTLHVPLRKGEPILRGKYGTGRGMASLVERGQRAFTIHTPTQTAGVAGFVLPGDRVDVLMTRDGSENTGGSVTTALLQNVMVLASDHMINAPEENKVRGLKSVTLLVSLDEGKRLTLAQSSGTLTLMLRNSEDAAMVDSRPLTLRDIEHSEDYSEHQASLFAGTADIFKNVAQSGTDAMAAMVEYAKVAEAKRVAHEQAEKERLAAMKPPMLPAANPALLQIQGIRGSSSGTIVIRP